MAAPKTKILAIKSSEPKLAKPGSIEKKSPPVVKLPKKYKKKDVLIIGELLKTTSVHEVIKKYNSTIEVFKKDLKIFRKMGYEIPKVSYVPQKEPKSTQRVPKKAPQKAPPKLVTRVIDESVLKWVRVDKRTMIQVDKSVEDSVAIEQYYSKRESMKKFVSRY